MHQQLFRLLGSTVLAAMLALTAAAQEYSNGGTCQKGRGPATLTPVEAFGVHPPGPDPADCNRCFFCWWKKIFKPYYAPVAPVATSVRWKPWCYFPLLPYYTPYYCGYCPHRLCRPEPPPYGYDGWGRGPMPCEGPDGLGQGKYGPYTSVIQDDTIFWNMGGNGLVPYGTPRPPHYGLPDLVDAIQATRPQGDGACLADGAPVEVGDGPAPSGTPAVEKSDEKEGDRGVRERKGPPLRDRADDRGPEPEEQEPVGPPHPRNPQTPE
jgi:hypothetical protein